VRGTAALFLGTHRPFELCDFDVPDPEPGALVVRVTQANVCGSDLHMWRGETNLEELGQPMPAVLGHEAVGEVVSLGAGVATDAAGLPLELGDRVTWRYFYPCGSCRTCLAGRSRACQAIHRWMSQWRPADRPPHFVGPYATHHYLPPGNLVFRVPSAVPNSVAAAANCAVAQAIQGLSAAGLRIGEVVVVQGAGGLGLYACALARAMGASSVVVLDAVAERLELARDFGADVTLNIAEFPDARSRVRAVKDATHGGGDLVCEFVGKAEAVAEGLGMVAPGGRYLECGCVHTGTSFQFDPAYLTLFSRSVHAVMCYEPWCLKEALQFLERSRHEHPWDRLTASAYSLDRIDQAFEDANERKVPRAAIVMH
jgi:threonine dehydrogenase-like Zn-dependent dehydrogenase